MSLTDQQTASIMAFVALLGAVFVRQQSTPTATSTAGTPSTVSTTGTAAAAGEAVPPSP
ncbi:hypothetical protein ACFQQB_01385 [Nonomuraea rubra]|uniref:hypothetical protein n=1 Tax=Nonomuraea rubra TaxID=46180 RepID=UPI0036086F10